MQGSYIVTCELTISKGYQVTIGNRCLVVKIHSNESQFIVAS